MKDERIAIKVEQLGFHLSSCILSGVPHDIK
jgi:hypothetical protein